MLSREEFARRLEEELPDVADSVPRRWQELGDVVVIRLFDERAWKHRREVGRILREVTGARSVVALRRVSGTFREPIGEVVAGDRNAETVHRELGIRFKLDPTRVMFARGNLEERRRLLESDLEGELVFDMFAGIGYFTLPAALTGAEVVAAELNPVAYRYLVENARLNGVEGRVRAFLGDCREVARFVRAADRVLMGYLKGTLKFLPYACRAVRNGGVLVVHEVFQKRWGEDRVAREVLNALPDGFEGEVLEVRRVKSFSPALDHYAVELRVRRRR
ncbi:class I SAM-dependent methyltransferase [Methanopyrus kandleri]